MTQVEPGDPPNGLLHESDVVARLSSAVVLAGGQKAWADTHGVSQSYVHDVLRGRRGPGEAILAALGLTKIVTYSQRSV